MTTAAVKLARWVRGRQPERLTCQQTAAAMDRGELTIVDVREDHERAQSRIVGSLHIALGDLASHRDELQEVSLAFICRAGDRSKLAVEWALEREILAANIVGGLLAWQRAGLPLSVAAEPAAGRDARAA